MKTLIVNRRENTRIPFLRGILTRALLDAGMSFDAAFDLATAMRNELAETAEISSQDLRKRVLRELENGADESILEHYRSPVAAPSKILVRGESGGASAFSRARHVRHLQSSGMRTSVAEEITAKIYAQLLTNATQSITRNELGFLTYCCIQQEVSVEAATRYLIWTQFERGDKPLVLLIGGAIGAGKSTIATQIAHRLEIVRTQSTDMLREVMRMMIPERLLPVLHASSFEAWKALPVQELENRDQDAVVAEGFQSQAELLSVPCAAVLSRADRENASLILEGVHALPELLHSSVEDSGAIMVHVTLAVLRSSELKSRLRGRSTQEPKRRAVSYLKNFDSIWRLQTYLLSEADRHDAPIITNDDMEKAVRQIINTINDELGKHYRGSPADVFGDIAKATSKRRKTEAWQQLVPSLVSG